MAVFLPIRWLREEDENDIEIRLFVGFFLSVGGFIYFFQKNQVFLKGDINRKLQEE